VTWPIVEALSRPHASLVAIAQLSSTIALSRASQIAVMLGKIVSMFVGHTGGLPTSKIPFALPICTAEDYGDRRPSFWQGDGCVGLD
jgi:hypothetical protein